MSALIFINQYYKINNKNSIKLIFYYKMKAKLRKK